MVRFSAPDDALDGGQVRRTLHDNGGHSLREKTHLLISKRFLQHRQMHMNAGRSGRFGITPQAEFIEDLLQDDGNTLYARKWRLHGIQVKHKVVRIIQVLDAGHPRILLDIAGVGDVQKLLAAGADEVSNGPLDVLGPDLFSTNPFRRVARSIFLVERLAVDAIRKPLENERTVEQMRNEKR